MKIVRAFVLGFCTICVFYPFTLLHCSSVAQANPALTMLPTVVRVSDSDDDEGSDSDTGAVTIVPATQYHLAQAFHKGTYNYLRSGPSRHGQILQKMRQGTQFQVVAFAYGGSAGKGYYKVVLTDGTTGWTAKSNVQFLN